MTRRKVKLHALIQANYDITEELKHILQPLRYSLFVEALHYI